MIKLLVKIFKFTSILLLLFFNIVYSQDNSDGRLKDFKEGYDINGDGVINSADKEILSKIHPGNQLLNNPILSFSQFWSSPPGAFGNCWDGIVGYFDNDTLLDVAGYTFSPNKFYIWEQ